MKLLNYTFDNINNFNTFVNSNIENSKHLFIQIFSGELDTKIIQPIINLISTKLPDAKTIGTSTAGEIVHGHIHRKTIQISFSIFKDIEIKTYYFPQTDFLNGVRAAKSSLQEDTKVVIALSEGLKSDSESFLNGFTSINSEIPLGGGNAGDNFEFKSTFIIKDNTIHFDGVVIASLNGKKLHVSEQYSLEWTPVSREMFITKADKNIIYEIDNKPVEEVFAHYLGEEAVANIPASAIEFPLVKIHDNIMIARSIVAKTDDNAFVFAGHFNNGEKVRFAIGNIEEVLNNANKIQSKLTQHPIEATYVYSCSVRDLFMKEDLKYEFGLIEDIAPMVGCFTYGEFFHTKTKNQLLNITTTTLSLSESTSLKEHKKIKPIKQKQSMLKSLTHLVNTTQYELSDNINFLNQYKAVLDESSIVSKTDTKGIITYVNDAFCAISGYTRDELIGQEHNIVKNKENDKTIFQDLWRTIKEKKVWRGTIKNLTKDGNIYYVKSVIMPILDENGHTIEYIASRTDVTELIEKDEIIQKQFTDELTGLKNREALLSELNSDNTSTLILLNIDRFSDINDYFGYETGDKLLKLFALKIKDNILQNYKVYRISSDEFAIICSESKFDNKKKSDLLQLIAILENTKYNINEHSISILLSCGLSSGKRNDLYRLSHLAIKESKLSHQKIINYNENKHLQTQATNNTETINSIILALKEDRFIPFFQGIVDNRTQKIVKYEALIRLREKDGTVLSPYFFLEHAKKAKLYDKLTQIMIEKTFKRFANLEYEFSINISLLDIQSEFTKEVLFKNLKKYKCGSRVVLEIVESEGIENFDELKSFIIEVKEYGCQIAIDDFGTGYSNFSYLAKLDIDYIKIDGSLIDNIDKDLTQKITVQSIILFARNMNIRTIAEFVENKEIYNTLVTLGVDFSQGYYFSKPSENL